MIQISPEQLKIINTRLSDIYGRLDGRESYFRLIWSEDCLEKRLTQFTDDGFQLLYPEVRELPKYKQWIQNKYILEGLTVVPQIIDNTLVTPLSYEPVWVFENGKGEALEPKWNAIYHILETIKNNQINIGTTKYKDPENDPKEAFEVQKKRIDDLEVDLFGDETKLGDALAYEGAIVVPQSYETTQINDKKDNKS